jgi:thioredoxin reductase (NADPH)
MIETLDALVIGAGPAGLSAAIYLSRFKRSFVVVDAGESRLGWIPRTHNHPGYPGGVVGRELLDRIRTQAEGYGAEIVQGCVEALQRDGDIFVASLADGRAIRARKVLLATGVVDSEPDLPAFAQSVKKGLIRICPICDGYEVQDMAVGVIGNSSKGAREALFLRHYSDRLTLIHVGVPETLPDEDRAKLADAGIDVIETPIGNVLVEDDRIAALDFGEGDLRRFDTLYSALGSTPRTGLATKLGAGADPAGCLQVNEHQETAVPGLYAAGDLVRGLNQISVAQGEAAIAATDIHNQLRQTPESVPGA